MPSSSQLRSTADTLLSGTVALGKRTYAESRALGSRVTFAVNAILLVGSVLGLIVHAV